MTEAGMSESASARIAFLRGLRAVRQLRPDPLPEPVLHDILEVQHWSGSAGNRQPWEFVVVASAVTRPWSTDRRHAVTVGHRLEESALSRNIHLESWYTSEAGRTC